MSPSISELMRALPELDEPAPDAREPLLAATMRPVPVGRWRRLACWRRSRPRSPPRISFTGFAAGSSKPTKGSGCWPKPTGRPPCACSIQWATCAGRS